MYWYICGFIFETSIIRSHKMLYVKYILLSLLPIILVTTFLMHLIRIIGLVCISTRDAKSSVTTGHNQFLPVQLSVQFWFKTNWLTVSFIYKKTDMKTDQLNKQFSNLVMRNEDQ